MSAVGYNIFGGRSPAVFAGKAFLCSVFTVLLALNASPEAHAQDSAVISSKTDVPVENLSLNTTPSAPRDFSDIIGLSPSLQGVAIELPTDSVGSQVFGLDLSDADCLSGAEICETDRESLDLGIGTSFLKNSDNGLDIQLLPRASVKFDDDSSSAVVGALVRIGDDLRKDPDLKSNTWYMFAGADAEAVTYAPGSLRRLTGGDLALQDRIIVGDAQAGIGYRLGDADVSLGYFRREVTSFGREVNSGSVSFSEDAAALSFTWRR